MTLLKHVKQELVDGLVIIFNKSFHGGCFPEVLKLSKVIPIHKGDETTYPTNYRPISLLSVFDKVIEKVMLNRILKFLKIIYCTNINLDLEKIMQLRMP